MLDLGPHTAAVALAAAWLLDAAVGEPPTPLHPVVWLGHAVRPLLWLRRRNLPPWAAFLAGLVWSVGLASVAALVCHALLRALTPWPLLALLLHALLLWSLFALRGLLQAGTRLADALSGDDLDLARERVSHLCSRDARELDASAVATAGIESLAENTHDSVVAPLFFYILGGLPALAFYRAVNTLDAMVGYRDDREYLGKAAARLDDLLNYIPARLSAVLLALSALSLGRTPRGAFWREARRTPSPNAGWPMAFMGAVLDVRLDKPGSYVLGEARPRATAEHLRQTVHVVRRAGWLAAATSLILLLIHGGPLVPLS